MAAHYLDGKKWGSCSLQGLTERQNEFLVVLNEIKLFTLDFHNVPWMAQRGGDQQVTKGGWGKPGVDPCGVKGWWCLLWYWKQIPGCSQKVFFSIIQSNCHNLPNGWDQQGAFTVPSRISQRIEEVEPGGSLWERSSVTVTPLPRRLSCWRLPAVLLPLLASRNSRLLKFSMIGLCWRRCFCSKKSKEWCP